MMEFTEDHIALAAEYALGTLDADERAQVELTMAANPDFQAMVEAWERRLAALHQMVGPMEPPPEVWERIKLAVGLTVAAPASQAAVPLAIPLTIPLGHPHGEIPAVHPDTPPASPDIASDTPVAAEPPSEPAPTGLSPESKRVVYFAVRAKFWRWGALGAGAMAASFFAIIVAQLFQPEILPPPLRPAVRTQVVRVATPPPPMPAQYVALLQSSASSPAFILTVDSGSKKFTVRKVGASQEPGKSYELWLVSDKLQRPRSLGVIGGHDFTTRAALSSFDDDTMHQATYAVTLEPEGGSPTGVATGPIVFTGKLIETIPQAPAPR
jgi:anti-sigma-K factor RskA